MQELINKDVNITTWWYCVKPRMQIILQNKPFNMIFNLIMSKYKLSIIQIRIDNTCKSFINTKKYKTFNILLWIKISILYMHVHRLFTDKNCTFNIYIINVHIHSTISCSVLLIKTMLTHISNYLHNQLKHKQ